MSCCFFCQTIVQYKSNLQGTRLISIESQPKKNDVVVVVVIDVIIVVHIVVVVIPVVDPRNISLKLG